MQASHLSAYVLHRLMRHMKYCRWLNLVLLHPSCDRECSVPSSLCSQLDPTGLQAIVLSTLSWVGGKNNVLGIVFIVVGALCFLTAIVFFCCYYLNSKRRKFGDEMQLSWNKPAAQKLLRRQ